MHCSVSNYSHACIDLFRITRLQLRASRRECENGKCRFLQCSHKSEILFGRILISFPWFKIIEIRNSQYSNSGNGNRPEFWGRPSMIDFAFQILANTAISADFLLTDLLIYRVPQHAVSVCSRNFFGRSLRGDQLHFQARLRREAVLLGLGHEPAYPPLHPERPAREEHPREGQRHELWESAEGAEHDV